MEYSTTVRLPFLDKNHSLPRLRDGDKEKPGYRYGWRLFAQVADTMGVELTEVDVGRWRTTFGITRALDDMIDEGGCQDIGPALATLAKGKPTGSVTQIEAFDFQASLKSRSEPERQQLIEKIKKLADFAKQKAQATSLEELLELTRVEIGWYTSLFELEEKGLKDAKNRQQFNDWLHSFMISGYMLDGLIDMEEDYENGNSLVKPSLSHKKALAGIAFRETVCSLRKTPVRNLGSLAYMAYRNVCPPSANS